MKCKKHHPSDLTSAVGVCASCLRERLLALIAAQERAHLARVSSRADANPPPPPPPLVFPRSVSPYVSRRKSDYHDHRHNSLFYSTPQVGPTFAGSTTAAANSAFAGRARGSSYKKKLGSFWIFSGLFRSRSDKFEANHRVSNQESCEEASSSSSPSWFSMIFPSRHKHHHHDDSTAVRGRRRRHRQSDRGMSPVTTENFSAADDGCDRSSNDYSTESSPPWRRTPSSAAPFSTRRSRHGRNVSVTGMAFCLSPLVRANPNPNSNPNRNPKGLPPQAVESTAASVDIRGTPKQKPHISTASSFCANRSRKLADFGRTNQNR